jgi:hypothetical protein
MMMHVVPSGRAGRQAGRQAGEEDCHMLKCIFGDVLAFTTEKT